jgi:hypothetical protein
MNGSNKQNKIPLFLAPFLWSYDLDQLDLRNDKKRIITNILNYGTQKATDWLFSVFTEKDIKEVIENPLHGEWNKKSINFWSLILNVQIGNLSRRIN